MKECFCASDEGSNIKKSFRHFNGKSIICMCHILNEVEAYLSERFTRQECEEDVIVFWSQMQSKWPKLAHFALKLFSTPPATVACESSFSFLRYFVSLQREGLSA